MYICKHIFAIIIIYSIKVAGIFMYTIKTVSVNPFMLFKY